jgi:hypothetical protein
MALNSGFHKATKIAYDRGYRVLADGRVQGLTKILNLSTVFQNKLPYYRINFRGYNQDRLICKVHQLAAYQKYGDKVFKDGIQVRHLDNNSLNNAEDNITIGTAFDNAGDKLPETNKRTSIFASTHVRKFSDTEMEEIRCFHAKTRSYKETMECFGISSKGTLHYMLNKKYVTKVKGD